MTTEIAIINRLGVALATDSAVTISGGGRTKVWDTADKLFELSAHHPIAIMINGNMDFLGVPWEILVKSFRKLQADTHRESVERWMNEFLEWVEKHPAISEDATRRYVLEQIDGRISRVQQSVQASLYDVMYRDGASRRRACATDVSELLLKEIHVELTDLQAVPRADSLENLTIEAVQEGYAELIEERLEERFPSSPSHKLTETERKALKTLLATALLSATPSDLATGLVFAGYGDGAFPSVHAVEVDGRLLGALKFTCIASESINGSGSQGRVVSFAQTDVIERLLGGADPRFVEKTADFIRLAVRKVGDAVETALRSKRTSKRALEERQKLVDEIAGLVAKEYQLNIAADLRREFEREFDRMIALMPKQEMIELAEALVSITAVERKASSDEGTVGGPVDVALITKHEGFVWIKRKHYFDKDLNPRYFWRAYSLPVREAEK